MGKSRFILLLIVSQFFASCASVQPVGGFFYSDVAGPVYGTQLAKGPLKGEACATSWFGAFATGDASIEAAAKAGNMNVVSHVDQHSSNIWMIKNTYCSVAYGYKTNTAK